MPLTGVVTGLKGVYTTGVTAGWQQPIVRLSVLIALVSLSVARAVRPRFTGPCFTDLGFTGLGITGRGFTGLGLTGQVGIGPR